MAVRRCFKILFDAFNDISHIEACTRRRSCVSYCYQLVAHFLIQVGFYGLRTDGNIGIEDSLISTPYTLPFLLVLAPFVRVESSFISQICILKDSGADPGIGPSPKYRLTVSYIYFLGCNMSHCGWVVGTMKVVVF